MLALALAGNPGLVIADEPTSALDASLSRDVMELMLGLTATSGIALLLVTHDIKLCEEYSDRTLVMYRGSVVEELDSSRLTTALAIGTRKGSCAASRRSRTPTARAWRPSANGWTWAVWTGRTARPPGRWPRPTRGPGAAMSDPDGYVQLVATDVTKMFGRRRSQRHTAVDGVSLTVESGQAVGIVGESGSGKSTFARMLAGIELPSAGSVYFNDVQIIPAERAARRLNLRRHVQMVAQDTSSSFDPLKTLRASVRTPVMRLLGLSRAQADAETDRVMADLELAPALADRYPQHVSGGQRQRFALAGP